VDTVTCATNKTRIDNVIKKPHILACIILAAAWTLPVEAAHNDCDKSCSKCRAPRMAPYLGPASKRADRYNWHANYAHSAYGQPLALVVPPTAQLQTDWSWGAPSTRISRIDHQFGRDYPGPGPFGGSFRNTPAWPGDTAQFGVYNVRGPWYPTQR
jgi:hypothetical protein